MKVVVIGGGASGLMAAYAAAESGHSVRLLEKNEKLGKKIYITGKGRCNVTNNCSPDELLQNVVHGGKFLTGAIYAFPPARLMEFLEERGLPLKTERGRRVFPVSDHASDVTKTLERACREAGVEICLNTTVTAILHENGAVTGVNTAGGTICCDAVVLSTGGLSYPSTGSTGDGYRFAREMGHTVTPCSPSLTGLELKENVSVAQGVSLKNVVLTAKQGEKVLFSEQGELLFTHYGISGPLALSLSARIGREKGISLFLDCKPALDEKKLGDRLLRDFAERGREQLKNVMRGLLPAGVSTLVLQNTGIPMQTRACDVTKEERVRLVRSLKGLPFNVKNLRGYEEAVITSGGVSLKEVDPKTMESKSVRGLYLTGEVLDVDALTGGYNLQIAFSTGYASGKHIKSHLA